MTDFAASPKWYPVFAIPLLAATLAVAYAANKLFSADAVYPEFTTTFDLENLNQSTPVRLRFVSSTAKTQTLNKRLGISHNASHGTKKLNVRPNEASTAISQQRYSQISPSIDPSLHQQGELHLSSPSGSNTQDFTNRIPKITVEALSTPDTPVQSNGNHSKEPAASLPDVVRAASTTGSDGTPQYALVNFACEDPNGLKPVRPPDTTSSPPYFASAPYPRK
jgi:hypothetical protein